MTPIQKHRAADPVVRAGDHPDLATIGVRASRKFTHQGGLHEKGTSSSRERGGPTPTQALHCLAAHAASPPRVPQGNSVQSASSCLCLEREIDEAQVNSPSIERMCVLLLDGRSPSLCLCVACCVGCRDPPSKTSHARLNERRSASSKKIHARLSAQLFDVFMGSAAGGLRMVPCHPPGPVSSVVPPRPKPETRSLRRCKIHMSEHLRGN